MGFELYHNLALELGLDDATEQEYGDDEHEIDVSIVNLKGMVKNILHN